MSFIEEILSPTRTVGLICCLVDLAACVIAFGVGRGSPVATVPRHCRGGVCGSTRPAPGRRSP